MYIRSGKMLLLPLHPLTVKGSRCSWTLQGPLGQRRAGSGGGADEACITGARAV